MKFFTKPYFILPFLLQATLWRIVMRPFFALFTRFEVHGLENLKGITGPVIFAPNHASELDSVLLPLALPLWSRFAPVFYIIREPIFYADPVFAWRGALYRYIPFNALGAYSIVSGVKNYDLSLYKHLQILHDGGSMCIFPEGAFSKNGEIGPSRGGLGYLAHQTNATVIPVNISGTFRFSFLKALLGESRPSITFLSPVKIKVEETAAEVQIERYREFGENVLAAIRDSRRMQISKKVPNIKVTPFLSKKL